jgi:hypothetical protein
MKKEKKTDDEMYEIYKVEFNDYDKIVNDYLRVVKAK